MGKKYLLLLLAMILVLPVAAQGRFIPTEVDEFGNQVDPSKHTDNLNDSTVEIVSQAPKLYQWHIDAHLGNRELTPVDTIALNFQNTNQDYGMTGEYGYLGNLGLPRLNRIFTERDKDEASTIFLTPFSHFYSRPQDRIFTNSNIPYTNLTYYKAGNKVTGEERFKTYFSVNSGKRLSFGFNIDYLYGRGYYANQSTAHFNGGLFASYIGDRYQMHAIYNSFYLKNNENGGISDDRYITNPEEMAAGGKKYESNNIPVNLEYTTNRNHDSYIFLSHRYAVGFSREVMELEESSDEDKRLEGIKDTVYHDQYVPVTSFIHTMKVERSRHSFRSLDDTSLFPDPMLTQNGTHDSTAVFSIANTLGINLLEGFNKYAKAGLTGYVSHKFSRYTLMNMDTRLENPKNVIFKENELRAGGELSKTQGRLLHYSLQAEAGIAGIAKGEYKLDAQADLSLPLGRFDTLRIDLQAKHENLLPSFYMRHYHSNFYAWDLDDMSKEAHSRLRASLQLENIGTHLTATLDNIKNYTYFSESSLPEQHAENIQVLTASFEQNFKAGIFHLDNKITYQKTSNDAVLPLPQWTGYHNLYILTKLAHKVLTVQLGADVRYFTSYNAPAYNAAIQQFRVQDKAEAISIGGRPIVNVYANLQLKRTRIFVEMYHVNAGMGKRDYFMAPHYPLSGQSFKIGLSWNFYD